MQSQKIHIAVRSRFVRSSDELPWYSSACGCEAGRGEEKRKGSSSRTSSRVRAPKGERPNRCSEPRGCRPERTPKPNEPRVHRTSSRTSSPVRPRTSKAGIRVYTSRILKIQASVTAHWHDKGADWRGLAHTPAHHRSRLSDSVKNGNALRSVHNAAVPAR